MYGPTTLKIKAAIESYCKREHYDSRDRTEMQRMMRIMGSILSKEIYVVCDRAQMSLDFSNTIERRVYWVRDIEQLMGLEDFNLIFIGPANKNSERLEDFAKTRRGVTIWRIDDWR